MSNDTVMLCHTPDLRSADLNISTLAVLHYGFIMADVQSVLDMSTQLSAGYFLDVFPDPEFDGFVNGVKQMFQPRNDYLTINVRCCCRQNSVDVKLNFHVCWSAVESNRENI